ncbi:S100P-binding protein isoform X2 [Stigmatopora argus]
MESNSFKRALQPLSAFALGNLPGNSNSFDNQKVKIVNNGATKLKVENINPQSIYESPAKKRFRPMTSTPREDASLASGTPPGAQYSPVLHARVSGFTKRPLAKPSKSSDPDGKDEEDDGYFSLFLTPVDSRSNGKEIHSTSKISFSASPASCGFSLGSPGADLKMAQDPNLLLLQSSTKSIMERVCGNETCNKAEPSETEHLPDRDDNLGESTVQVVNQATSSSPQAASHKDLGTKQLPVSIPSTSKDSAVARPVVFKTEADWELNKRTYIQSVRNHIQQGANPYGDAVSEVWHLMMQVGCDSSGKPWQHPSDLTHRKYGARNRHRAKVSLSDWFQNQTTNKRFEKVEKIFRKS